MVKPPEVYRGKKLTIHHCKGALKSFDKAISQVEARKRLKDTATIISQIHKLANEGEEALALKHFPWEGNLPGKGNKFRAFKRIPIRGYCWNSSRNKSTYYISHYIFKDQNKLDASDTDRVQSNWKRIEDDGHEF